MKTKTYFYKIYFGVIAVFLILLVAGLFILHDLLFEFEKSQATYAVNTLIENYIKPSKIYEMKDKFSLDFSEYESKDSLNLYISDLIKDKEFSLSSTSIMPEGCDEALCVKVGDDKLMNVYLKKSQNAGKYGLFGYDIVSCEFTKNIYKTKYIHMYSDSNVVIGKNMAVNLNSVENLPFPAVESKYFENNPVYSQKATLDKLVSGDVLVSFIDDDGIIPVNEENGTFVIPQRFDNIIEISDFATKAVENYAAYMQNDIAFGTVARYFLPGTDFYKNLSTSLVLFAWDHDGYVFEDVETSDFHKYSDDLYSCRVTFTQKLLLGNREYTDNVDKVAYITKSNGQYKVVDLQSVGAENE